MAPVHPTKHPEYGIDFSGGSLAQGLSFATGLALGRRLKGETWHTYALVGMENAMKVPFGNVRSWPHIIKWIT
jgi:transketolase N-terminal domain/subunit